jgi:hypothetical protein
MQFQHPKFIVFPIHNLSVSKFVQSRPADDALNSASPDKSIQNQSAVSNLDWPHALNISVFGFVTTAMYRQSIG